MNHEYQIWKWSYGIRDIIKFDSDTPLESIINTLVVARKLDETHSYYLVDMDGPKVRARISQDEEGDWMEFYEDQVFRTLAWMQTAYNIYLRSKAGEA